MPKEVQDPVLQQEWSPAAFADAVKEAPVSVNVMGERIVLFRTSLGVRAFQDLCIHRGAALSLGRCAEDTLVCPYHGWQYDADGHCIRIPQRPEGQAIPAKAKAKVYACLEAYGIVWVHLGDPAAVSAELPVYPEYEDPAYRSVICGPYDLNASVPRVIENFLDVGHLAFLHEGYLGDPQQSEISDYQVFQDEGGIRSGEIDVFQPNPDGRGASRMNRYVYEVLKPTVARLKKSDPLSGAVFTMLFAVLPVEPVRSRVFALVTRNYDLDAPGEPFAAFQQMIIDQDAFVVESQRPELRRSICRQSCT
ncbi:aromatic ring-hydroxylating dioxygenase subunit alpha [Paenibacillus sp. P25]|nr:aromatic ring-hydroxylating dioxygenase subunit alpha [Paenibacillus sp. P25]